MFFSTTPAPMTEWCPIRQPPRITAAVPMNHPGGAHPFVGLHEALVHNGDFANYASVCTYLAQRNIEPLFLSDTEVSVLMFDLLQRTYGYAPEYVIETLAPTTERDFARLPPEKQEIYRALQTVHIHGSPDGPWFFLIAQSAPNGDAARTARLIGITDTSMLRPQVFALQDPGDAGPAIGLAASEKQAIDVALESLAAEDTRFWSRADLVWNARGGSHTDGGAFAFTVERDGTGSARLRCTDKFGRPIRVEETGSDDPALWKRVWSLCNGSGADRRRGASGNNCDRLATARRRAGRRWFRIRFSIGNGGRNGNCNLSLYSPSTTDGEVVKMKRGGVIWSWFWMILGILYFFLPLIATFMFSLRAKRGILSFKAYDNLFHDPRFATSFSASVMWALFTIAVGILIFVPTAYWVRLRVPQFRAPIEFITLLPFVVPAIVYVFGLVRTTL